MKVEYEIPTEVETLKGFIELDRAGLESFVKDYGLAMDADDIAFCQQYFKSEDRDPTITEIRMIDTYWSDHCRHTTFSTELKNVEFEDGFYNKEIVDTYEAYVKDREEIFKGRDDKFVCLMKYLSRAAGEIVGYPVDVMRTCYTPKELDMIKAALTK